MKRTLPKSKTWSDLSPESLGKLYTTSQRHLAFQNSPMKSILRWLPMVYLVVLRTLNLNSRDENGYRLHEFWGSDRFRVGDVVILEWAGNASLSLLHFISFSLTLSLLPSLLSRSSAVANFCMKPTLLFCYSSQVREVPQSAGYTGYEFNATFYGDKDANFTFNPISIKVPAEALTIADEKISAESVRIVSIGFRSNSLFPSPRKTDWVSTRFSNQG